MQRKVLFWLDAKMAEWKEVGADLKVSDFMDIAALYDSIEATLIDTGSIAFLIAGNEERIYEEVAFQFRFALAQIGSLTDDIRFPELGTPINYTAEEIAQEAERLGVPFYLPEDDTEDFHARLVREQTGEKMPPRRLEQIYSNLSSRRRREMKGRGIEQVNKYGFEVDINYPYKSDTIVPLKVKVSNDGMRPPFYFCIEKTHDS